jgi:hypothetical protein
VRLRPLVEVARTDECERQDGHEVGRAVEREAEAPSGPLHPQPSQPRPEDRRDDAGQGRERVRFHERVLGDEIGKDRGTRGEEEGVDQVEHENEGERGRKPPRLRRRNHGEHDDPAKRVRHEERRARVPSVDERAHEGREEDGGEEADERDERELARGIGRIRRALDHEREERQVGEAVPEDRDELPNPEGAEAAAPEEAER